MVLQLKQEHFLQKIKQYSEIIHLSMDDAELIDEVLYHRAYSSRQRPQLERLRQRWYGNRDNKTF